MSDKLWGWPESTCVGCGRRILSGTQQKCHEMPDGLCSWHVPAAIQSHIACAEAVNRKLLETLRAIVDFCDKPNPISTISLALRLAALLILAREVIAEVDPKQ